MTYVVPDTANGFTAGFAYPVVNFEGNVANVVNDYGRVVRLSSTSYRVYRLDSWSLMEHQRNIGLIDSFAAVPYSDKY